MITLRKSTTTPAIVMQERGDTLRITSPEEAEKIVAEITELARVVWRQKPTDPDLPKRHITALETLVVRQPRIIVFGCPGDGA
jgi:hypothetical protein